MRGPTRLRITWLDDDTLKLETDYGMQTRLLRVRQRAGHARPPPWQGRSVAQWIVAGGGRGRGGPRFGAMKSVTTNLQARLSAEERRALQREDHLHRVLGRPH